MKRIGLLLAMLVFSGKSWACLCGTPPPLTPDILKNYPYVALVKIASLEVFTRPGDDSTRSRAAKFSVEAVENFKGPLPPLFVLESYKTSCDIGLRPGQTWVIFAKENKGQATVYACDYSLPYDAKPIVSYQNTLRYGQSAEELLNSIRQLAGRPIKSEKDRIEKFYADGRRALLTAYKWGGQEEERTVWHENGRLWGKEFYKKGLKNGPATWWNANGTPSSTETFMDGIVIDTSRYWYNTDIDSVFLQNDRTLTKEARDSIFRFNRLSHLRSIRVTNRQGRVQFSQEFDWHGRLRDEVVGRPDMSMQWRTAYDQKGNINFLIVTRPHDIVLYRIDYEPDGSRQVAYYDDKGRLIRWTKVKDGLETVLEEKKYPD